MKDVRWKQRFQSFDRAYMLLHSAFENRELDSFSDLECEGLIQRFEYTFELGWKVMKDFLEYNGVLIESPVSPRSVIKEAYSSGLISDGQVWIDMMLRRNQLSHMYDSVKAQVVLREVKGRYLGTLGTLHDLLMAKLGDLS